MLNNMTQLIHIMMDVFTPAVAKELNIGAMHYGDQDKLVARNTVCFEPDTKTTDLTGANRMVNRRFRVHVLVYTAAVTSTEMNREESDDLAEKIEAKLNALDTMNGQVLHSYVSEMASGYANKRGTVVRAARLTFDATTRDRLQ